MKVREEIVSHIPRLRRYAVALTHDADRAEDLVQETLARALNKINFWRIGTDLRAWLFTLLHNQYINDAKRAARCPVALPLNDEILEARRGPASAEQERHFDDIALALMQLPEQQRSVLLLISLEGLSYRQAAEILGIRLGTVMSRLHRARTRLRDLLEEPVVTRKTAKIRVVR